MGACSKACQKLLAVTLHLLPLLVSLQRERKTKMSTENREMNVFSMEEGRGMSETVQDLLGKGTVTAVGSQTWVSCTLPASLGDMPAQHCPAPTRPPASIQTRPAFLASHRAVGYPRRSYFGWGIFWLVYRCAPLDAVLIRQGQDLRLPVADTTRQRSFPLRNDSFSHGPSH